jgi:ACS family D-galactonate transporter-like MFS transporter
MTGASAAAAAARPSADARRWTIIGLLSLGMVIAYVSRSNLSIVLVLPDFIKSFHLSDTDRGVLNSAFFWAYAALQIPAGWVVDRYGVKLPYAVSFLFWCIASALTAFTGTLGSLYVLRVLVGAGEAVVAPASYRWIRVNFEEKERGLAIGLYMTGTKIGPAIAAPLAAWLVMRSDWRAMFLIVGAGGLVWLVPWLLLVQNDRPRAPKAAAVPSAEAVPFARVLASPVTWGAVIATFCYMYFVYFCMTWMPAYFVEQRHLTLARMGVYTFFSFGGMAIVAVLGGWAADLLIARGGNPVTVRKWFTIAGFAVACTELIGAQSESVTVALAFAVISLSGLGLATANYWALTQTLIPAAAIGRISGVQNCAASVAGIVAPILTGWLKQQTGSYQAPMQAIWFFLVVGVLAYIFLVREKYAPRATAALP